MASNHIIRYGYSSGNDGHYIPSGGYGTSAVAVAIDLGSFAVGGTSVRKAVGSVEVSVGLPAIAIGVKLRD